ncbi:glycerate kinase [Microbacterium soli]|uniref:Glycerate 2-kinase n=1 Tax=Microbacterium soli TaxID=446075 RepID=A0ABP7ML09_9MICO
MSGRARIVIAPDSFKGSVDAAAASAHLAKGWREARPDDEVLSLPMADGGEGTMAAFAAAGSGAELQPITVTGPHGAPVRTSWLRVRAAGGRDTAVVELAATSGIELLSGRLRPMTAHTLGFGQALDAALRSGADQIYAAVGGSSSTDAGVGMLRGLGARALDRIGNEVPLGGSGLEAISTIDLDAVRARVDRDITVLSDVTAPLIGPTGAAAIFGPQKGASSTQIAILDRGLSHVAAILGVDPTLPGTGAAGGTGAALAAIGAQLRSGAAVVADAVGLQQALGDADLLITGEGRFDLQSMSGKVIGHLVHLARTSGTPVSLVAGQIAADVSMPFAHAVSLSALAGGTAAAQATPERWLREAGRSLASRFGRANRAL